MMAFRTLGEPLQQASKGTATLKSPRILRQEQKSYSIYSEFPRPGLVHVVEAQIVSFQMGLEKLATALVLLVYKVILFNV